MANPKKTEEEVVEVVEVKEAKKTTTKKATSTKSTAKKSEPAKAEEIKEEKSAKIVDKSEPKVEVKEEQKTETVIEEIKPESKVEPQTETKLIETKQKERKIANKKEVAENGIKVMSTVDFNEDTSYIAQIVSANGVYTFKNPTLDAPKGKILCRGAKVTITEVKGNWGKISEGKWILLSSTIKV